MRVTRGLGTQRVRGGRVPRVTVVAVNSIVDRGCRRVPRWGCPLIPTVSTFHLSLCPDSPRHQGWLSPHPCHLEVPACGCPHILGHSCLRVPAVPAIPTSRVCHPRVSLSPCPQVWLSHTPCPSCPRVPPPSHSRTPGYHCPRDPSIHPRVPAVPTAIPRVWQTLPRNLSVPKSHPAPSPCPTAPRVSPTSRVRRAQSPLSPRLIPVQYQALPASSLSLRRGNEAGCPRYRQPPSAGSGARCFTPSPGVTGVLAPPTPPFGGVGGARTPVTPGLGDCATTTMMGPR